jgi:hypothetical protein
MGDSRFARFLQGGGVFVGGGIVSIVNSLIYSNTAAVYATETLNISHRPDWKIADALASTLAWQLWLTLLSTTVCTCHRDLEISHPDGKMPC